VQKATKKYESALEDADDYKKDLEKTNTNINENQSEQVRLKGEIEKVKSLIADLKGKLSAL
jgi:peptidoglycan hydrolase CwlO-like protein